MSRIRSIHPGLFTDDRYMELGFPARELIKGIWCEADDQGVFEWRPRTLKARIMPADIIDVSAILDELAAGNFIVKFEMEGRSFGVVRNFRKYQRPKKPTVLYPLPAELRVYAGLKPLPKPTSVPHQGGTDPPVKPASVPHQGGTTPPLNEPQFPTEGEPDPVKPASVPHQGGTDPPVKPASVPHQGGTGGEISIQMEDEGEGGRMKGKDEGGKERNNPHHPESLKPPATRKSAKRAPAGAPDDEGDFLNFPQEFEAIWPLFPWKIDRGRAFEAFAEARRRGVDLAVIRAGIERFAEDSAGKARKYVARPANWILGERWLDEPEAGEVSPGNGADHGNGEFAYRAESAEHWEDRCTLWFDESRGGPLRSRWIDGVWGPAPGEPGCRCPAEVLAGFRWGERGE